MRYKNSGVWRLSFDLDVKYCISGIEDIVIGDINEPKKFTKLTINYNEK